MAAEAQYNTNCYLRFGSKTTASKVSSPQRGRKAKDEMMAYLDKAYEWLETEPELHTVKELQEKMIEYAEGRSVYGVQYVKR